MQNYKQDFLIELFFSMLLDCAEAGVTEQMMYDGFANDKVYVDGNKKRIIESYRDILNRRKIVAAGKALV